MLFPEKQITRFVSFIKAGFAGTGFTGAKISFASNSFASYSFACAFACVFAFVLSQPVSAAPVFDDMKNPLESSSGYYTIAWKDAEGKKSKAVYELVEFPRADGGDARMVYRGEDRATTLSGRPNGTYYYRIREVKGEFAPGVLTVRVRHHSLNPAFLFLGAGAAVFLAPLILIILGSLKVKREQGARE